MFSTPFDVAPPASRRRRPRKTALIAVIAAVFGFGIAVPSAFAADGPFSIDGTVPDPEPPQV